MPGRYLSVPGLRGFGTADSLATSAASSPPSSPSSPLSSSLSVLPSEAVGLGLAAVVGPEPPPTAPLEHALSVAQAAKKEDREAALQKHLDKVYDQQQLVKPATEAVGVAEKAEAVKNLKALQASATAEAKAPMTVLGIRHLVQDRLEWQKVMDDKSNKNSGVWDKIAVSYNARVQSGVLPPSDRRSVDSLKAKWSTLDGAFKQHCRAIQRRKDSGASRDDVDAVVNCAVGEHGKTVATDIFFKFGRQERPAVVPPHAINGGSADKGGTYNAVCTSSAASLACAFDSFNLAASSFEARAFLAGGTSSHSSSAPAGATGASFRVRAMASTAAVGYRRWSAKSRYRRDTERDTVATTGTGTCGGGLRRRLGNRSVRVSR